MIVESWLIGIISNFTYDVIKKVFSKKKIKTFEEIYNKISKKISKGDKVIKQFIKKFSQNSTIKNISLSTLPKTEKIKLLLEEGSKLKPKKSPDLNIQKIIEEFYSEFKSEIMQNPVLANILSERYQTEIISISKANNEDINYFGKKILNELNQMRLKDEETKKEIMDKLNGEAKIEIIQDPSLPIHIVAYQKKIK